MFHPIENRCIAFDIVNQARYVSGYYIPTNWEPPAIMLITKAQVEAATAQEPVPSSIVTMPSEHAEEVITLAIKPLSLNQVQIPDPWTLPADELVTQSRYFGVSAKPAQAMLLLPSAHQLQINLAALKLYKLRSHSVVRVEEVPVPVPPGLRRYQLREQREKVSSSSMKRLSLSRTSTLMIL